jgi:hypothetical protein
MTAQPRRHWFAFSLRTMFLLVTVLAILMTWVSHSLNWIRQRREVLQRWDAKEYQAGYLNAPGMLWLFGEKGYVSLTRQLTPGYRPDLNEWEQAELDWAQLQFPEAEVFTERQVPRPPRTQYQDTRF